MKEKFIVFLLVIVSQSGIAQQVSASHMWTNGNGAMMEMDAIVDSADDSVTITLTGPIDQWFAYGFGGMIMSGNYVIALEREEDNNVITERQLAARGAGNALPERFRVISESDDVVNGRRSINLKLPISGNDPVFDFPVKDTMVNFISAAGFGGGLSFHGSDNFLQGVGVNGLQFSSVVPVEWARFQLKNKGQDGIALEWSTASEEDNLGFEVQRSKDGRKWVDIGFVESRSDEGGEYTFIDSESLPGINYYRLKQIDLDGSVDYSIVKSIDIRGGGHPGDIVLFPNPVIDEMQIQNLSPKGQKRVQVINMNYQVVMDDIVDEGSSNSILNVSNLKAGYYLIMVMNKDWSYGGRFVKQ